VAAVPSGLSLSPLRIKKKEMNAKMDANQAEIRYTVCAIQSELEEIIQHEIKGVLSYVDEKTQNRRMELTETIEKQMELGNTTIFSCPLH
jgi:hypothetical protein